MGSTATATVCYGIDLGDSDGGYNFVTEDEYGSLPEPYDEELDLYDLVKESGIPGIEADSYGYEFQGQVIHIRGSEQTVYWDCEPLEPLALDVDTAHSLIRDFLLFLDAKGLVLKDESREPQWLLMARYG